MDPETPHDRQGEESEPEVPPALDEEEIYAGTKIDSQEEAVASDAAAQEAAQEMVARIGEGVAVAAYTLSAWRVRPGQEADFVAAWQSLAALLARLPRPPAGQGVLVQSVTDPSLFYSLGPWQSLADIEAMRENEQVQAGLTALRRTCTEGTAGTFRTVAVSDASI